MIHFYVTAHKPTRSETWWIVEMERVGVVPADFFSRDGRPYMRWHHFHEERENVEVDADDFAENYTDVEWIEL